MSGTVLSGKILAIGDCFVRDCSVKDCFVFDCSVCFLGTILSGKVLPGNNLLFLIVFSGAILSVLLQINSTVNSLWTSVKKLYLHCFHLLFPLNLEKIMDPFNCFNLGHLFQN